MGQQAVWLFDGGVELTIRPAMKGNVQYAFDILPSLTLSSTVRHLATSRA